MLICVDMVVLPRVQSYGASAVQYPCDTYEKDNHDRQPLRHQHYCVHEQVCGFVRRETEQDTPGRRCPVFASLRRSRALRFCSCVSFHPLSIAPGY